MPQAMLRNCELGHSTRPLGALFFSHIKEVANMFLITQDGSGYTVTSLPYYIRATFASRERAINYIASVWEIVLASHLQQVKYDNALMRALNRSK